jgi:hypothetical protein
MVINWHGVPSKQAPLDNDNPAWLAFGALDSPQAASKDFATLAVHDAARRDKMFQLRIFVGLNVTKRGILC